MEAEKASLMIAIERQKVKELNAQTAKKEALIKAQSEAEISKVKKDMEIMEEEAKMKIQSILDKINLNRATSEADALYYRNMKEAESNEKILTENYLKNKWIDSLNNSTKLYFGESIPKYLSFNSFEEFNKAINNGKRKDLL
jgi:uncharacterized membrane protein YqiK